MPGAMYEIDSESEILEVAEKTKPQEDEQPPKVRVSTLIVFDPDKDGIATVS
jgi:hypothetical protein